MKLFRYYNFDSPDVLISILDSVVNHYVRLSNTAKSNDIIEQVQVDDKGYVKEVRNKYPFINYASFCQMDRVSLAMCQNFSTLNGIIIEYECEDNKLFENDDFCKVEYVENPVGCLLDIPNKLKSFKYEEKYMTTMDMESIKKEQFVLKEFLRYKQLDFKYENEWRFIPHPYTYKLKIQQEHQIIKSTFKPNHLENIFNEVELPEYLKVKRIYLAFRLYHNLMPIVESISFYHKYGVDNLGVDKKMEIQKFKNYVSILKTYSYIIKNKYRYDGNILYGLHLNDKSVLEYMEFPFVNPKHFYDEFERK